MEENEKTVTEAAGAKTGKKPVKAIAAVVILVISVLLGTKLGVFDGFSGLTFQVKNIGNILLRLVMMAALLYCVRGIVDYIAHLMLGKGRRLSTISTIMSSCIRYITYLAGFCWALAIIGVDISTIFASVGVIALIVGFGAESLVEDIVTGIFMLFEDQFGVGDIIEVDGARGTVEEVGIRTVSLRDSGGNVKIINNSNLKNIINRSHLQSVAVADIGVSYDENLEELEKKIEEILNDIEKKCCGTENGPSVFLARPKYLGVEELADSAVVLRFTVDVSEENIYSGRRALNRELKVAFDKAGISIPYPQLDVHNR